MKPIKDDALTNNNQLVRSSLGYFSLAEMPSREVLQTYYTEKYFQEERGSYQKSYTDQELLFLENESKVSELLLHRCNEALPAEPSLLDVGAGEGFFSKYFHANNWQVTCCDYSTFGMERQNPGLKENFMAGDLIKTLKILNARQQTFQLVNLKNVIEHVLDPQELLELLRPLVGEQGLLRVVVPNDYSAFQKLLSESGNADENWFCPPEHLHYFQLDSIKSLISNSGFEVQTILSDFPIEIFNSHPASNYYLVPERGKDAHRARISIDNFIAEQGLEEYIAFYEAAAEVCLGRQIIVFAKQSSPMTE